MKKFRLLLCGLMVAGFAFTSCSDDDSDGGSGQASLNGRWFYAKEGVSAMGIESLNDWNHEPGCIKDNVEFAANGVFNETYYYEDCDEDKDTGTWSTTGNKLTVSSGGSSSVVEIVELTENILKIRQAQSVGDNTIYDVQVYTRN